MLLSYIGRRLIYCIVLLFFISIIVFIVIQLPPGDYASTVMAQLRSQTMEEITR